MIVDAVETGAKPPASMMALILAWLMIAIMFATLATFFFSHFMPSSEGGHLALAVATVVGLRVAWLLRPGSPAALRAQNNPKTQLHRGAAFLARHPALQAVSIAFMIGVIIFTVLQNGMFAVITAAIGRPGSRVVTVEYWSSPTTRNCGHFGVREAPMLLDRAFCAASPADPQGVGGRKLLIQGRQSVLGMNVERLELLAPAT